LLKAFAGSRKLIALAPYFPDEDKLLMPGAKKVNEHIKVS
jgi:hypothetical protein